MNPATWFSADGDRRLQVLWEDGERVFCKSESYADGRKIVVLAVLPAAEHPTSAILDRLAHEYGLRDELDGAWAVRPLEFVHERGRTMLLLEETGSEPLHRLLGLPMEVRSFLLLAIGVAAALTQVHQRGLVHKDIKPANILVNRTTGEVRLTGFGIASRLPRERQPPAPPESIVGTLAYMAPEQTGRMNRSIDARSDLYALGVTFYQMITGSLPFSAADPMEWVHCHIARKPSPPTERLATVPAALSNLALKLLAKTAEERYQTAAGLERDLRRCLAEWEAHRRIDTFPLGEDDMPDRLLIAEKLYGREREVESLLGAFDRVVSSGRPEIVLVAGYSGIGKSAVVNELHKALVPSDGLFASGKFDQYKRDIPYATLVQAAQSLVRQLLGKSEAELANWREALLAALGPNGRLMADLVPELDLVIGEQPPVPELPPQSAQRRFQLVVRRFIGVFARTEHPLVLFLDDLQWVDVATLAMLEDLLTQADVRNLLFIGAYRDNEVDATHPLRRKLDAIKNEGGKVGEISLTPFAPEQLGQLIADALRCAPGDAVLLTQLVHEKTNGNPFFVIQFLHTLAEERLLSFDHASSRWTWDLSRIQTKGYTDNVVDLMVGRLNRLPVGTQKALQQLACIGNSAEFALLAIIHQDSKGGMDGDLWEAVRTGLVLRSDSGYRFLHDRVQEAAYSLIPEDLRPEAHLRIGRLLAAHIPAEKHDDAVFEIVNQLNRGAALITSREERERLAEFNLIAGRRARASTAYAAALTYLAAGAALLPEDAWELRHALFFALELGRGECELLTGAQAQAEQRLAALSTRAANTVERASVACLRIDLYATLAQGSRGIAVGLDYLRHLGIDWSPHPMEEEARRELCQIWSRLGSRTIESLIKLPLMSDPASLATMDVLAKVGLTGLSRDPNLRLLVACRTVNLSLEHGNCDASCIAYIRLGLILLGMVDGRCFDDYQAGFRFGQLGHDLVEGRGLRRFQARVYMVFGNALLPWTKHVRAARNLLRSAFDAANTTGELIIAAHCGSLLNANLLMAGDPLVEVQREAEHGLAFARKARFGLIIDYTSTQLGLVRTLRGLTPTFGSFDDEQFDERRIERRFSEIPDLETAEFSYWIRKLQARFLAGDLASAVGAALKAQSLLWTPPSLLQKVEYHFYGALSRAAACDSAAAGERQEHLGAIAAHHRQLEIWAANCPENFENRAALVGAEIARIDGRDVDAMRLYEQAIHSAQANGFVHNEALAYELASRFYAVRGFEKIARVYLRDARHGYLRWGADGKVRQLDELYPHLREETPVPAPTSTIGAPVEHLDLATVIKVSQAISGEIVLETLIDTLMRTAIEQAGAERGLLLLRGSEKIAPASAHRIWAEATTGPDSVLVRLCNEGVTAADLPETVLQYVLRTQKSLLLGDAATERSFAADPYILQRKARSILCLPLINQAELIGVLYLENNLVPRVFAPARVAVLKLLASQAAMSVENSRLYRGLVEREAKIRRLVDANIMGVYLWEIEGQIVEANDTFLRMVGYDREDLVSGRVRWTDMTPPEWRDLDTRAVNELMRAGRSPPVEKEYFRKDGSRVAVLIGSAAFDEQRDQGVAFVLDLTERKRSEEAVRESEELWRAVFENNPTMYFMLDAAGIIASVNPYGAEKLGYAVDELVGYPVLNLFQASDRDAVKNNLAVCFEHLGRTMTWEFRKLRKDGTMLWVRETARVMQIKHQPVALIVCEDITDSKRAEYLARQVFERSPDRISIVGRDYRHQRVNPAFEQRYGRPVETFVGKHVADLLGWEAFEKTAKPYYARCFAGEEVSYAGWFNIALGRRYLSVTYSPLRPASEEVEAVLVISHDLTEQMLALEDLREAQMELAHANRVATMGQLTASIAHEISQPITGAVTNAHAALRWLGARPRNLKEVRLALDRIVKDANRAGDVIGRIREIIKKAPPRKDQVDMNEAIREVIELCRGEAAKNGASVQATLGAGLPFVEGDRVQLQQVVLNLIVNAVQAVGTVQEGPRELSIITARTEPEGVLIMVKDSGPGVAPADLEQLFAAFYTTKPDGLGMGLSICRSIIEAHGGQLWATANLPQGAIFNFTVPAHPTAHRDPSEFGAPSADNL